MNRIYTAHAEPPRRGWWKNNEEVGAKEKTFRFLPSVGKNKKSDSYSNYCTTRRDNSKGEPSVEEVQCSTLGTEDSNPKQCCCLWPVMEIGWVVESPAFRGTVASVQISFCAPLSLRENTGYGDLVCPFPPHFYGWADFKFPLDDSKVGSSS